MWLTLFGYPQCLNIYGSKTKQLRMRIVTLLRFLIWGCSFLFTHVAFSATTLILMRLFFFSIGLLISNAWIDWQFILNIWFCFFVIEIKMIFFQKSIDYKGQTVLPSLSLSFIFSQELSRIMDHLARKICIARTGIPPSYHSIRVCMWYYITLGKLESLLDMIFLNIIKAEQFASDGHLLEVQQIVFDFSLQMLSNRPR